MAKIFDFLEEKSDFLGGHREKNAKNASFHPKKWSHFEKKQFFENENRGISGKNRRSQAPFFRGKKRITGIPSQNGKNSWRTQFLKTKPQISLEK